ncbi:hypothetical protein [Thiothrix nivea]|uniref:Uncharacterized protein n=1 Tax=Thiothrix nivea (strain ATCC 35100 / DSM 5205 / JP2) TaxID=870187 RepID=A0A656HN41_THINJ|nr:hypothetical protein [Thiothrix nivea]EIJ36946.1 hypothetical protein Thini_4471 [Thiothrix nivea DSM 5205]
MYFTREKNKTKEAVYSGRFAFLPCIKANSLSDSELYNKYNDAVSSNKVYNDISEEFYHSRQVTRSITGLSLNGFRWLSRIYWLLTGNKYFVGQYYLMRSIFYCFAYDILEKDAGEKEKNNNLTDNRNTTNKIKIPLSHIARMDFYVVTEWLYNINLLLMLFYILAIPVLFVIGFVITKHFTLNVNRVSSNGKIYTHLISNQKYISDITESVDEKTTSWRIGTYIQPEYWAIRLRGEIIFEDWVIEKFASEYVFYEYLYKNIHDRNERRRIYTELFHSRYGSYKQYMYDMVDFSILCSCIQSKPDVNINFLSYKVKNLLAIDQERKPDSDKNHKLIIEAFEFIKNKYLILSIDQAEKEEVNLVIFFFYLHGN